MQALTFPCTLVPLCPGQAEEVTGAVVVAVLAEGARLQGCCG